jgi:hypothetical protein
MDVDALFREVRDFCEKGLPPEHRARAEALARIKPHVQRWYKGWEEGMVSEPYYAVNSRV